MPLAVSLKLSRVYDLQYMALDAATYPAELVGDHEIQLTLPDGRVLRARKADFEIRPTP